MESTANLVQITLKVNGKTHLLHVEPSATLSAVLRQELGLTGVKEACHEGACGACTIQLDGEAALSCMILAVEQEGKEILTIEGLSQHGKLHPIQEAWLDEYGAQCGYCSSGMIMTTKALLEKNPKPTRDEAKQALSGNICICSNYEHILNAVENAAERMGGEK